MTLLRDWGSRLLGASVLDWVAAGAGHGGTRFSQERTGVVAPLHREDGDTDHRDRTDREREIELRVLMSNWM